MIGTLLKQLMKALWLFVKYRVSRLFGRREEAPSSQPASAALPTPIAALNHVTLDSAYASAVAWRTERNDLSEREIASNPLFRLWKETPRGHKWTHYFEAYQAAFGPCRYAPMKILEIGGLRGIAATLVKSTSGMRNRRAPPKYPARDRHRFRRKSG